ncbi:MAG: replication initiation protein [Thiolinea sp.]
MVVTTVSAAPVKNPLVAQSNKLTEARYTLTVAEQRFILTLISFISPNDEDFKDYEIKISEFQKMLGIKSNTVYSEIKPVLLKLQSRVIQIPDEDEMFSWFSYSKYVREKGTIRLRFDKALKPYLIQLKEQFTQYRLFTIAQFQSSYTIRIYMLLKQYENIGYREISLIELRNILEIKNDEYKEFKHFRTRVINQAKKEFEKKDKNGHVKSDITFDLETIRAGRKITRLRFNIRKQKYQEQLPFDIPEVEPITPAIQALIDHNISEATARKFHAEQGEEEILRCMSKYEAKMKAGKVENKDGGYLRTMLEGRAGKESKSERDAKALQQKKQAEAEEKARQEAMQEAFKNAKNEAIAEFLEGLDEEQQALLIQEFEGSEIFTVQVKNNIFVSKRYESDGVGCAMVSPLYKRFITNVYLPKEYLDIEQWQAVNA